MCWTSGPAAMSDGVMTPSKRHRNSGWVLSAIGSGTSHETLREDSMSRSVQKSPTEKKEIRGDKLDYSQTDATFVLVCGIPRTAYCVCHPYRANFFSSEKY